MEKLDPKAVWMFFFQSLGVGLFLLIFFGIFGALLLIDRSIKDIQRAITESIDRSSITERSIIIEREAKLDLSWGVIILLAVVVIWIFGSYGWAKLSYNAYKFELTEEVFKKEHGVIWKKYVSIPYERIQNIDIHRGIIARILGLSDLMIQTAGHSGTYGHYGIIGGEPEGRLPALSKERAEAIREELIRKAKGEKSKL